MPSSTVSSLSLICLQRHASAYKRCLDGAGDFITSCKQKHHINQEVDQRPEFLKFMFEGELEVFFGDQTFIQIGLPIGEDFSLVFRHTGADQAFNEGMSVEGDGLSLHGARNSGWGGGLQAGVVLSSGQSLASAVHVVKGRKRRGKSSCRLAQSSI